MARTTDFITTMAWCPAIGVLPQGSISSVGPIVLMMLRVVVVVTPTVMVLLVLRQYLLHLLISELEDAAFSPRCFSLLSALSLAGSPCLCLLGTQPQLGTWLGARLLLTTRCSATHMTRETLPSLPLRLSLSPALLLVHQLHQVLVQGGQKEGSFLPHF